MHEPYLAAPNNKGESVGVFNNQLSLTAAIDLYLRGPDCKIDYKSIATLDADSLTQLKEQILKPENWSKIVSYGPNLVDLFKIDSSAEVKFDEMAFADSSFDAEIARLRNFQNSNMAKICANFSYERPDLSTYLLDFFRSLTGA